MTIAFKIYDKKIYTATIAINSSVDITGGVLSCPNDSTMVVTAVCLFSHFAAGHQNAGGSIYAACTVQGKNGTYGKITIQSAVGPGALGTNPTNGYTVIPPVADTIIAGAGGLVPPTAVWDISALGAVTLTVANDTGSTAAFDVVAWVDIFNIASS